MVVEKRIVFDIKDDEKWTDVCKATLKNFPTPANETDGNVQQDTK
jgi:hypothetical protein